MAGERRTRAEKARATIHRQEHPSYTFQADTTVKHKSGAIVSQKSRRSMSDVFEYDVSLIYRDLLKTVIITLIILAAVVGIKLGVK